MVIITQQSEFQITGDVEAIKNELAKAPLEKEPSEGETGVFLGKFYPQIVYKDGLTLTLPASSVVLSGNHIGVRFDAGVSFFKDEDEKLYAAIVSYINHIVRAELTRYFAYDPKTNLTS